MGSLGLGLHLGIKVSALGLPHYFHISLGRVRVLGEGFSVSGRGFEVEGRGGWYILDSRYIRLIRCNKGSSFIGQGFRLVPAEHGLAFST